MLQKSNFLQKYFESIQSYFQQFSGKINRFSHKKMILYELSKIKGKNNKFSGIMYQNKLQETEKVGHSFQKDDR